MRLTVVANLPINMRLKVDADKVIAVAGRKGAKLVKARLLAGQGSSGPMPIPRHGGPPLQDTGQMLGSVKYQASMVAKINIRRGRGAGTSYLREYQHRIEPTGTRPAHQPKASAPAPAPGTKPPKVQRRRNYMLLAVHLGTNKALDAVAPMLGTEAEISKMQEAAARSARAQMRKPGGGIAAEFVRKHKQFSKAAASKGRFGWR